MNTLTELFSSSVAQRIGWALVHFLWQGAAVGLVLALVLQLLHRRSPQARYVAACCALGLLAALPVATAIMTTPVAATSPAQANAPPPPAPAPALPEDAAFSPEVVQLATAAAPASIADTETASAQPSPPEPAAKVAWLDKLRAYVLPVLPWGVLAWLAGVVGLSLWHFSGWLVLQRIRRLATPSAQAALVEAFGRLAQRLAVSRPVRLLESALVKAPVVIGWLRPVVLLPAGALCGLSPAQVEAILAHELAHIRRWDCLVRMIQAAVETLLFYHPAVWWVSARIRQESENCCDELAVNLCGDRRGYAQALAVVAGVCGPARQGEALRSPGASLTAGANGGKLLPRLRRILGLSDGRPGISPRHLAGLSIALSLLVAALVVSCAVEQRRRPSGAPEAGPARAMSEQSVYSAMAVFPEGPVASFSADNAPPELASEVEGRIIGTRPVTKDAMVLSSWASWDHGLVNNIGVSKGGTRTLLAWARITQQDANDTAIRFILALYAREVRNAWQEPGPLEVHRILADWPEVVSWDRRPASVEEPAGKTVVSAGKGWKLFDVTNAVREAVANDSQHGVMLCFAGEKPDELPGYQFVSREGTGQWQAVRPLLLLVDTGSSTRPARPYSENVIQYIEYLAARSDSRIVNVPGSEDAWYEAHDEGYKLVEAMHYRQLSSVSNRTAEEKWEEVLRAESLPVEKFLERYPLTPMGLMAIRQLSSTYARIGRNQDAVRLLGAGIKLAGDNTIGRLLKQQLSGVKESQGAPSSHPPATLPATAPSAAATRPAESMGPREVGQEFLAAVAAGQDEKAKGLTTPETVKAEGFPKLRESFDLAGIRLAQVLVGKEQACIVTAKVSAKSGGGAMTLGLKLAKNGGRWLVRDLDPLPTDQAVENYVAAFMKSEPDATSTPATQPAANRAPAEIAQELLARISDATDGKIDQQGLQALAVLRDSDLDFAKLLKDEYFTRSSGKAVDVVRNSVILKALECLGTSQAKQSLLAIACTEQPNAQTLGPRAVQALAKITKDSDEIALVLRAPHSATRDAAAQAMAHRSLSAAAVDALATQMTSSSWITQNLVGTAFATDTSPTSAARKIAAILENYPKLGSRVDDKQAVPEGVFWTPTEMARSSYISALSAMEGGEKELRRRMADASREQREPLLLALGRRGVGEVRPALLKMARNAEENFVRANAVASLYYITTEEDMAFLRDLAESDPFERAITGGRDGERKAYPVRDAARQVMQRLEKDQKAPSANPGTVARPVPQPATRPAESTGPGEVGQEFLAAVAAGQDEKAKGLTTPDTVKAEGFPKLRESFDLSGIHPAQVLVGKEQACLIAAKVPVKGGGAMTLGLKLRKNGDRWLVRDLDALPSEQAVDNYVAAFMKVEPEATSQPATKPMAEWGQQKNGLRVRLYGRGARWTAHPYAGPALVYDIINTGSETWSVRSATLVRQADTGAKALGKPVLPPPGNVTVPPGTTMAGVTLDVQADWPEWRSFPGMHKVGLLVLVQSQAGGEALLLSNPIEVEIAPATQPVAPPAAPGKAGS